jgi:hypothetical protein
LKKGRWMLKQLYRKEGSKMNRRGMIMIVLMFVFSLGFVVANAYAGEVTSKGWNRAYEASDIIGSRVWNLQREDLGRISDLVIDDHGRVDLAILSSGWSLRMGEKVIAVPFAVLTYDSTERHFVFNISKERLESAPAYDKAALTNHTRVEDIYKYFGQQPYWTEGEEVGVPTMGQSMQEEKPEEFAPGYP